MNDRGESPQHPEEPGLDTISNEALIAGIIERYDALVNYFPDDFVGSTFANYDFLESPSERDEFVSTYRELPIEKTEALRERLSRYPLIDLGSNTGLPLDIKRKFGISDYTGVDLVHYRNRFRKSENRKFVRADLLEYMLKQPDNAANIMANGVLHQDFFGYENRPYDRQSDNSKRDLEYVRRLFREIQRVLPDDGIFLGTGFHFPKIAAEVGLQLRDDLSDSEPITSDSQQQEEVVLYVYEKQRNVKY